MTDCAARVAFDRPDRPFALEVRPTERVASSEPAFVAVTTTSRFAPARMFAGLARARLALAEVATTSRLSWKAADVTVTLATFTTPVICGRTLPMAKVGVTTALAKSKTLPEMATEPPVSAWLLRPTTPLALEVKPRLRVSSKAPAVAASIVSAMVPVAPAARLVGAVTATLPEATAAVTSRLSW